MRKSSRFSSEAGASNEDGGQKRQGGDYGRKQKETIDEMRSLGGVSPGDIDTEKIDLLIQYLTSLKTYQKSFEPENNGVR